MATHLTLALHASGCEIKQVLSREFDHAALLASRVGAHPIDKYSFLDDSAEVFLLAVNDDALFNLALDLRFPDALVIHTSGSTPADVLKPISRHYGVVWSPQTFMRDIAMDYTRLSASKVLTLLSRPISSNSLPLSPNQSITSTSPNVVGHTSLPSWLITLATP